MEREEVYHYPGDQKSFKKNYYAADIGSSSVTLCRFTPDLSIEFSGVPPGRIEIVPNSKDQRRTPSLVYANPATETYVGSRVKVAMKQLKQCPFIYCYSFDDIFKKFKTSKRNVPLSLEQATETLIQSTLAQLSNREDYTNTLVYSTAIVLKENSIPEGIKCSSCIAAAIAQMCYYTNELKPSILVFDFGEQECRASFIRRDTSSREIREYNFKSFEYGGSYITWMMLQSKLKSKGIKISDMNRKQLLRAWDAFESAKVNLSHYEEAYIEITDFPKEDDDFKEVISILEMKLLLKTFLNKLEHWVDNVYSMSREIQDVLIVGANSGNPVISELLERKKWQRITYTGDIADSVAIGCAVYSAMIDPKLEHCWRHEQSDLEALLRMQEEDYKATIVSGHRRAARQEYNRGEQEYQAEFAPGEDVYFHYLIYYY